MFCPNCGQQQLSDNVRFCSRCGLEISGLAEWLAGGRIPGGQPVAVPRSPRRKGISRGAKLMFFSGVLVPIFFGISVLNEHPGPMIVPLTIFLAGLALMLYARLFSEDIPQIAQQPQFSRFGTGSANPALGPANEVRLQAGLGRPVKTAEFARPPSVTENTTKLLDNE
jgi:hypothetical protein